MFTEETFHPWPKILGVKWVLLSYLCDMMTALNTLNESMQGECRTMIDFADKVRVFKVKLEF